MSHRIGHTFTPSLASLTLGARTCPCSATSRLLNDASGLGEGKEDHQEKKETSKKLTKGHCVWSEDSGGQRKAKKKRRQ